MRAGDDLDEEFAGRLCAPLRTARAASAAVFFLELPPDRRMVKHRHLMQWSTGHSVSCEPISCEEFDRAVAREPGSSTGRPAAANDGGRIRTSPRGHVSRRAAYRSRRGKWDRHCLRAEQLRGYLPFRCQELLAAALNQKRRAVGSFCAASGTGGKRMAGVKPCARSTVFPLRLSRTQ